MIRRYVDGFISNSVILFMNPLQSGCNFYGIILTNLATVSMLQQNHPINHIYYNEMGGITMANKYAGTQTEKNLEAAFAGESQARNKYTYVASKAKKEGFE